MNKVIVAVSNIKFVDPLLQRVSGIDVVLVQRQYYANNNGAYNNHIFIRSIAPGLNFTIPAYRDRHCGGTLSGGKADEMEPGGVRRRRGRVGRTLGPARSRVRPVWCDPVVQRERHPSLRCHNAERHAPGTCCFVVG